MILRRLGLIHKNQRGIALIELLLAFLITGVITGGITMTIFQVFNLNTRSTNHMIAVKQVQNAGYWISRDAQMAQNVALTADPDGLPLTLTWTGWDGAKHQVVYRLEDMTGGLKQLERQHLTYDADGNEVGNETTIVAQYIDSDETKCQFGSGTFSLPDVTDEFTIYDAVGGDSGTITVTAGSVTLGGTGTTGGTVPNYTWSTTAGQTIIVTATAANTQGVWTVATRTATVAITADANANASVTRSALVFTMTATVQEQSETRVYRIIPRPGS